MRVIKLETVKIKIKTMLQEFSYKEAFEIQLENLQSWNAILKIEVYLQLIDEVIKLNNLGYDNPYQVCRGADITDLVIELKDKSKN
jgi:hypothetical protein